MKVFTYGTLMRGFNNHRVMQMAKGVFISRAMLKDKHIFFTYPGSFPAVVDGRGVVYGEIFEVPDENITIIDNLEGYSSKRPDEYNMYLRKRAKAYLPDGSEMWVSYYYWNRDVNTEYHIPHGDWGKEKREKYADRW